jgi:hypothetical protein
MSSYQDDRDALRAEVIKLRQDDCTWGEIALRLKIKSAATVRRMYTEAGLDPHVDLSGMPTRVFEPGDWCKDTCIASEASAACGCRCGRVNHAGGPSKALEILTMQGHPQDYIDYRVREIAAIKQGSPKVKQ